jgi:hypothetical protein
MSEQGGEPLRHKMVEGKATFWVTDAVGRTHASSTLRDLATELKVPWKENAAMPAPEITDRINLARAASITGYSRSAINHACTKGELPYIATMGADRGRLVSKGGVMKWAEANKQRGYNHLPRRSSKTGPRSRAALKNGKARAREFVRTVKAVASREHDALDRLIAKLQGTPLEISREEFVKRAVDRAIAQMGNL